MPPPPSNHHTLTLIGAGRLGRTLARLWVESGTFRIGDVFARSAASARSAVEFIGSGQPLTLSDRPGQVELVLLAVPDDQLADAAAWLAERAGIGPGSVAFHCSGAHPASVLEPLRAAGAAVASAHPMHSFADPAHSVETFAGTFCALEGDDQAMQMLEPAFEAIGARPLQIDGDAKLLYHAGGVCASNYVTVLIDAALRLLEAAGIATPTGRQLIGPLVRGAVDSALSLGPGTALTGPVARGDANLVARQAHAVAAQEAGLGDLYRLLARSAIRLAASEGRLDTEQVRDLESALEQASQPSSMRTPTTQSVTAKP